MKYRSVITATILFVITSTAAFAQSFAGSVHFSSARWSEFRGYDSGIGGRLTWMPSSMVGVDADVTWYPTDFPAGIAFTRSRTEGLFGATVGPRLNRVRPFAKAAAGFLKVGATPGAFACITIFPPPLNCALAGGDTLPAFEIGGGVEIDATSRTFIRVDVTDRILRYPGPTFDSTFELRDEGFLGHALRFTIGAGLRF
jgi:hypothetical protein